MGEELLKELRDPAGAQVAYLIDRLVDMRDVAVAEASALFRSGDTGLLPAELQSLAQQQRALEGEMVRFMGGLKKASRNARQVRTTLEGTRRLMSSPRGGRLIDQLR